MSSETIQNMTAPVDDFELIVAQIAKVKKEYHENAAKMTSEQIADVNAVVKNLNRDLVATLTKGAAPCPLCKQEPHAIYHGEEARKPFEVGCFHCAGLRVLVDEKDKPLPLDKQASFHARASSREGAIRRWNGGPATWDPLRESIREKLEKICPAAPAPAATNG